LKSENLEIRRFLAVLENISPKFRNLIPLKGIVGAVVIFNHGFKFGIIFLVSDHPAHEKLIASKKRFFLSNN
jgi:hypothetical protein